MKLFVHNFLSSKFLKGVTTGYPLKITATKFEVKETEFNRAFLERMMPRMDWTALKAAATAVGGQLPDTMPEDWQANEELLKNVHHLLMETDVSEGFVECPETGRQFPISNGILNMLAKEDEVA